MNRNIARKTGWYRAFLVLTSLEGITALVWFFSEPSMDKNAWIWGYSKPRLMVSLFMLTVIMFSVSLTLKAWRDNAWINKTSQYLDRKMNGDVLSWTSIIILSTFICGIALITVILSPLGNYVSIVQALILRSLPLLIWGLVILIQVGVLLSLVFIDQFKQLNWRIMSIWRPIIIFGLILISLAHWTILFFRLDLLTSIPGWFWIFHEKSSSIRDFYLLIIFLIPLATIIYILKTPARKRNIIILVLLGLFLQYSFGFVEGGGFDAIRRKYADTQHSAYAMHASDKPDLYQAIAKYEQAYGDQRYLQTKPPGVLTFYILTQKVSNLVWPEKTFEGRYQRLTWFITFVFPLLSLLVIIFLYKLMTPLIGREHAILPCILYVISPNVVLMPLFLDQVLYPLVFTLGAYLFMRVIKTRSLFLAVIAGVGCYVAMFLSFSLITILPFAVILIGLDFYAHRTERHILQSVKLIAGIGTGVILTYLVFALFLHYDFFTRYNNMMIIHRYDDFVARFGIPESDAMVQSGYKPGFGQVLYAIFLNNITFAAWAGFAVYLLFSIGFFRTIFSYIRRNFSDLEVLLGGFAATFIALNLFGDTTGEVARLWIFMLPMMVIYSAKEISTLSKDKNWGFYLIVVLQLVTVILTYKFQDFIL